MRVTLHFLWFDLWIGVYWDRAKQTLYLCPLPMCVVKVEFSEPRKVLKP